MRDWWTPIRRLVNRDDDLSLWRRAVLHVVDPAEIYMRRDEPRPAKRRSGNRVGWTSYGSAARPAPRPERSLPSRAELEDRERRHQEHKAALQGEFFEYFKEKARSMLPAGSAVLRTTHGLIAARVVKFWHGDSVLEIERTTTNGNQVGHSLTRLNRGRLDQVTPIARYLAQSVLEIDPDSNPLSRLTSHAVQGRPIGSPSEGSHIVLPASHCLSRRSSRPSG